MNKFTSKKHFRFSFQENYPHQILIQKIWVDMWEYPECKMNYLSACYKLHYLGCHVDLPRMQHVAIFLHVANSTPLSPPCNASSPQLSPSPASSCIRHEQFPWGILLNKIEQKSNQTAGVWLDSAIKQNSNILPVFRCKFDLRTNQQNLTVLWC